MKDRIGRICIVAAIDGARTTVVGAGWRTAGTSKVYTSLCTVAYGGVLTLCVGGARCPLDTTRIGIAVARDPVAEIANRLVNRCRAGVVFFTAGALYALKVGLAGSELANTDPAFAPLFSVAKQTIITIGVAGRAENQCRRAGVLRKPRNRSSASDGFTGIIVGGCRHFKLTHPTRRHHNRRRETPRNGPRVIVHPVAFSGANFKDEIRCADQYLTGIAEL